MQKARLAHLVPDFLSSYRQKSILFNSFGKSTKCQVQVLINLRGSISAIGRHPFLWILTIFVFEDFLS